MKSRLLLAVSCVLLAACTTASDTEPTIDSFEFTEDDVARFRELVNEASTGVVTKPTLEVDTTDTGASATSMVVDLSLNPTYNSIRSGPVATGDSVYRVTNQFLNVRSEPRVTAAAISRLEKGDTVELIDFVNAAWAKVRLPSTSEGYVATRYIAKLIAEEKIPEEEAKFADKWFVDFGFLNVRSEADTTATQLGQLPGQAIITPLSMDDVWARIMFEGKEGYVARQYLSPFKPSFLVRQEVFRNPIIHFRLSQPGSLEQINTTVTALEAAGYTIESLTELYDVLIDQEEQDVRLPPNRVFMVVSDITGDNVREVSDTLKTIGVTPTLFVATGNIGFDGITEKQIVTLGANGFDVQSSGHTNDDLRSLTNAQVELQVRQSRKILEDLTGRTVYALGYPVGGYNDRVVDQLASAGYLFGVGTDNQPSFTRAELLTLPSIVVTSSMTNEELLTAIGHTEGE